MTAVSRDMTPVSRETLAQTDCETSRRYLSFYRQSKGERTRAAIIGSALKLIAAGNFRPEAKEIAADAGCDNSAVTRHFGAVELLYRVIAREHTAAVAKAAGLFFTVDHADQAGLVWLIMVGRRREKL
jgi:AcrR family transcriptional regulator